MAAFSYPGVYIEELPSGQHTITGVATSIAAFVGWAAQGPVNQATLVQSWSDYTTAFGGLDSRSKLGYAVNQFFANGGDQCYIVRLVWDGTSPPANGLPAVAQTAVANGLGYATAQITATSGSVSGSMTVGIGQPALKCLQVQVQVAAGVFLPHGATLPPMPTGSTGTLSAQPVYSDNGSSPALPSGTIKWSSNNPGAVAVDPNSGAVTAVGYGTATITANVAATATSGPASGCITLSVSTATSATLSVSSPVTTLASGQQAQLTASASYNNGASPDVTAGVGWSTSVPTDITTPIVAGSVSVVSTLAQGFSTTGTFTATFPWSGTTAYTTPNITITGPVVMSAAVFPAGPVTAVGGPAIPAFNLWGPASNNPQNFIELTAGTTQWTSTNTQVASIDQTGTVTVSGPGTTTITGTSGSFSASTILTVTPATTTLNAISISPARITLAAGLTQQLKATGVYSDGSTADLTGCVTFDGGGATGLTFQKNGLLVTTAATTGTITATWPSTPAPPQQKVPLTVTQGALQSIQVTPNTKGLTSIPTGQTAAFTATATFSDGGTYAFPLAWSASPPALLQIASSGTTTANATATTTGGGSLSLFATNPGAWGNSLRVTVTAQPPPNAARFNVLVQQVASSGQIQTLESFVNLSVNPSDPNYVVTVIDNDSAYVTFLPPGSTTPLVPTGTPSSTSTTPVALGGGADGGVLQPTDGNFELAVLAAANPQAGINVLDRVDIFNLLCVPGETDAPTISTLQAFCARKRAFYIVDSPQNTSIANLIASGPVGSTPGSITAGDVAGNSAFYFPWILAPDPLAGNRPTLFPPCGFVAGLYAATDATIGVWKAPAGINAALTGNSGLQFVMTDLENGSLNPQAVNCLRQFKTYGDVVWGARTLAGNDQAGSQWKYVPIRRVALYIESSLLDGTQWAVFEPNDERLWGQIRLNVGTFLQGLFLQGAFAGTTPQQAYFVKCDAENNPPSSVAQGVVNILVGFAPLYPAEFVLIQIQQMTSQS